MPDTNLRAPGPVDREHDNGEGATAPPPIRGRSRGRWLFGVLALTLVAGAVTIGFVTHGRRAVTADNRAALRANQVPTVRVETVRAASPTFSMELPGTIAPVATASLNARATGYIAKRMVDIGARVRTGDLLAAIESRELDAQVQQAEETLRQATANHDLATVTAGRSRALVGDGWTTRQQFDNDRQAEAARAADVRGAEAALAAITQRRAYLNVVAPFDGIVTQRNVDVGDLADADSATARPLFVLARTDTVRVQVQVPQDNAGDLVVGDPASVVMPARPGHPLEGHVTRTAEALASGSRTLLAEAEIPNPDGALVPGAYVRVTFQVRRAATPALISADSLIYDADGLSVAVVKGDRVDKRKIAVGRDFGTEIEVPGGLSTGERAVLNPPSSLAPGQKVRVLTDASP